MRRRSRRHQLLSMPSRRMSAGRAGRQRSPRRGRERGSTAIELAILAPIFLMLIFFTIQAGLFFYGRTVAVQAAREGVSQLRLAETQADYDAIRVQVEDNTRQFAASVGRQGLSNAQVVSAYYDTSGRVEVYVTGNVISLVPGLNLSTTASASGVVERFQEPERP